MQNKAEIDVNKAQTVSKSVGKDGARAWRDEMSEWRPIESAPKDGTVILTFLPAIKNIPSRIVPLAWRSEPSSNKASRKMEMRGYFIEKHGGYWAGAGPRALPSHGSPTHWMPLPPPPTSQKE